MASLLSLTRSLAFFTVSSHAAFAAEEPAGRCDGRPACPGSEHDDVGLLHLNSKVATKFGPLPTPAPTLAPTTPAPTLAPTLAPTTLAPTPAPTQPDRGGSVTYDFKWFPSATYDENALDGDTDKWWRCGSGGVLQSDDGYYCEGAKDTRVELGDVGDSCQTMGDLGSRQTGEDAIFFGAKQDGNVVSEVTDGAGKTYLPVLVLFSESDYCTGEFEEFYGQDGSYTPLNSDKQAPGARYIKAWRIYFKPTQGNTGQPDALGIKTVFFPYFNMAGYDEMPCTSCGDRLCDGKFIYKPFPKEDDGWSGLDCVSSDDRVNCFAANEQNAYGTVQGPVENGYGCIDFAGCFICNVPGNKDACESQTDCGNGEFSEEEYCTGSPVLAADPSYPLGSFYYNLYFQTKGQLDGGYSYCGDSGSTGADYEVCDEGTDLHAKYAGYCVATRFYDCLGGTDCGGSSSCPASADASPFTYASTPIDELCDGLTGACFNTGIPEGDGDMGINCEGMTVFDFDSKESSASEAWPLRTTCYITKLVKCEDVLESWPWKPEELTPA